jgi:alginate O-acetyltransferase complex protein AlgI
MILLGVTKKLVIADRLSAFADQVFANPAAFSPLTVIFAVVAYSLQIYCDFSGYSDIAIGASRIIGFDLPENFNMPYLATSVTEFWRRWHITLSEWLRDYLYIPLGGNRKGRVRTYVNLMATMLLGGLWHGASWNFVFWGLLHGGALAVHKLWAGRRGPASRPLHPVVGWAATYAFVCVTWVFFRAQSFADALAVLRKITGIDQGGIYWPYLPLFMIVPLVVLGHVIGRNVERLAAGVDRGARHIPVPAVARWAYRGGSPSLAVKPHAASGWYAMLPLPGFVGGFVLAAWLLLVIYFSPLQSSPFIYFQF